jgi:MFS family permease
MGTTVSRYRHLVLSPYSDLLRLPGTLKFSASGFVARLPLSMLGLGCILFLTLRGNSYAVAGAISAAGALTNAFCAPILSRYIDRYGQHRVLPFTATFSISFQAIFIILVLRDAPIWTWFLAWCLGEVFIANIGSLIRARWAYVLTESSQIRTAFAFESVVDEIIFIAGPPIATFIALGISDFAAIVASMMLLAMGAFFLVPQRSTEPPRTRVEHHEGGPALLFRGMPIIALVYVLVGTVFGAFEVGTVAFTREYHQPGMAGILLAAYSVGSAIAGLIFGAIHLKMLLPRQFLWSMVALAVACLPLPFIHSVFLLGFIGLFTGFTVSPVLITGSALTEELVPSSRMTEGLSIVGAGIGVGFALGSAVSGVIIDAHGASPAFGVLSGAAVIGAIIVILGQRTLDSAFHDARQARTA